MSSVKKSAVAKMKSMLRREEKRMAKRVSSRRRDEILSTGMDLSPGIRIPDKLKQPHQKICHIIYHHFAISSDTGKDIDTRRNALHSVRKLLSMVKTAIREENENTTAVANTKATKGSSQRKSADQASSASGKENLLEVAKQHPPQTKNVTTISSRPPPPNHPSPSQVQRNPSGSGALGQQQQQQHRHQQQDQQHQHHHQHQHQHKPQRSSFSLSNYCQANDAYKETNPPGFSKTNPGNKVQNAGISQRPPPFRNPPPYQEKSPLLGGGKEAQKRQIDSSKRQPANHVEARRKLVVEDQNRLKGAKHLEEQRRREEAKKREEERLVNQRAEILKKEEEKRKRLKEEKRKKEEAERKRIEEQQRRKKEEERKRLEEEKRKKQEEAERKRVEEQKRRKKEEERKRLEEAKRKKEEAEQKRKEEHRRKKEAERKIEEEKRKKAEKQKRQEEQRKEKERQRVAELKRVANEKKESEISAVMQAAEGSRKMEMRVVFPADTVKPYKNSGESPRPETMVRFIPHRINKTEALDMATRLLRWDPYWEVRKYVKCGMTTGGDDILGEKKFGASFSFTISGSDIRDMRTSDWGVALCDSYQDLQTRLILRMLPVTPSDKNRADLHLWPKGTYLYLNGKALSPSQRKQQSHDLSKWQGLCKPLDLTEHIQRPTDTHEIKILSVEEKPYYFCIALCKYMSPAKLIKNYINAEPLVFFASSFEKLSLEQSKAKAKSFTQQATFTLDDSDEEEAAQPDTSGKFVFTLTCPFSKTILKNPVRGKQCKHYQCFDLTNFLNSNRTVRGNQWRCMVCEQFVSFYDLSLDSLVEDLAFEFRKELVPTDRDRIEYRSDGSYVLLGTKKPRYNNKKRPLPDASSSSNLAPKNKPADPTNAEPEIILLDDDDD